MCTGMEIAMVAGTAMTTVSAVQQGNDAQAMGNYQAAQAKADAEADRGAAKVQADKIRRAGEAERGRARAALAASGASLDSASADAIDDDIVSAYEEDALVTMYSGDNRARSRLAEGESARLAGGRAKRNATMEAAATVGSGWYRVANHRSEVNRARWAAQTADHRRDMARRGF